MKVKVTSHVSEIQKVKDAAVKRALEIIGLQAEGYAKEELSKPKPHADGTIRPNIDTGRLRNSISHAVDGDDTAVIGTNVEYGPHLEFGTSRAKAYPFLKPAVQDHLDEYKQIVLNELEGL